MHFIQTEICGWDEHAMPAPARREEWSVLIAPSPASFMDVGEVIATTESALPVCHAPGTDVHCTGFLTAIFLEARSCLPLHTDWGRIPSGFPFTSSKTEAEFLAQGLPVQGAHMASRQTRNAEEAGGIAVETGSGMQTVAS